MSKLEELKGNQEDGIQHAIEERKQKRTNVSTRLRNLAILYEMLHRQVGDTNASGSPSHLGLIKATAARLVSDEEEEPSFGST